MSTEFSITYDKEARAPHLGIVLPEAMRGTEGDVTLISLARAFNEALVVAHGKNVMYGGAWRRQGWMGNLARIKSKVERLNHMLWRDHDIQDSEETSTDTALDLLNITGFFMINRAEENKWGHQ